MFNYCSNYIHHKNDPQTTKVQLTVFIRLCGRIKICLLLQLLIVVVIVVVVVVCAAVVVVVIVVIMKKVTI